jgi:hypothetical protein
MRARFVTDVNQVKIPRVTKNLPEFALYVFPGPYYDVGKTDWIEENLDNIPTYYAVDNVILRWPAARALFSARVLLLNSNLNKSSIALYYVNLSLSIPLIHRYTRSTSEYT